MQRSALTGAALSVSAAPRLSSVRGFSASVVSSTGLPRFSDAGDLGATGDLRCQTAEQTHDLQE
jgi:hypothetical protein